MKSHRKATPARKPVRRRSPALSLSGRVERLEKLPLISSLLFPSMPGSKAVAASAVPRFINVGANGKPTTGEQVAVFDSKTGLTWSAGPLGGGKDLNHVDAMKACAALDLLGQKDWRAPTIEELLSIVDYSRIEPAVNTDHFKGPFGWTWSSTIAKAPSGYAWYVGLDGGYSGRLSVGLHGHVRAVRAGQQLGLTV
jgi:hypothetical protein